MSQLYPGLAPLTVNISGTGSNGVLVSSGSGDPHGIWPTPLEMTGGDKRFAVNMMAAVESLTSRTNWLAWRMPDFIAGGTYTWTGFVTWANTFLFNGATAFNNQLAVTGSGFFLLRSSNSTPSYIGNGTILNLGDPVGADGNGFITVQSASQIHVLTGGSIEFDAGSTLTANTALNSVAHVISAGGGGGTVNFDCSTTNTFWISGALGNAPYAFTLINAISGSRVRVYCLLPASVTSLVITHVLAGATTVALTSFSTTGGKYLRIDYSVIMDPAVPATYLVIESIAQP